MGGKAKQTQRTKGNLRAASSAVASNLIHLDPFSSPLDYGSSIVASFSEDVINIDSSVDPSFQLVLRKMTKKDSTTKIKALKEFTDLVNQSEADIVTTVLTFFPKIYVQLSTDVDSRVREGAQASLAAVVNKVGKSLATILKQIFPAWVCGQYDTHPPAASIAKNCFEKVFPPKKVSDVFAFCETETLDYLTKNLIVLNQQTVCNPKSYSPEECEAKYHRVVISSLRGYASYLEKISKDKLEQSTEKNLLLVDNDRFWSFQKNKSNYIRSAFFECLSSLLQHASFLLVSREEQLTSNVFKADETDPMILSHVWTCIILIQANIENWSKFVNVKKSLLPKMWKVLRSALFPCVIYPNLLPLVSKLDAESLPDGELHNFYVNFFENINFGLRNVQMGRSEMSAVSSTYYEMLKFITMQTSSNSNISDKEKLEFASGLLDDHVIAVIFWCFNADSSFGKHIFSNIASLLGYWSKNSHENELYQQLLNRFWSELYQVLRNSLETCDNISNITHSHVDLFRNLKSHSQNDKAKGVKIKFIDSNETAPPTVNEDKIPSNSENSTFMKNLNQTVYKLCEIYTEQISSTLQIEFVDSLEILVKEYQSDELFLQLAKWKDSKETNICALYDTFSSWLIEKDLRCESIIEIILVLYKYLKPSEKIDLLERWIRVPFVQTWIILRALSYPLCMEPDITKLLRMSEVTEHLAECAKQVTKGVYKDNLIILQKCFFQTEDGNILIDSATCEKIIEIVSEPLKDESKISQMDQCGSFLAQILPVICSDEAKKTLQQKIFLSLFELTIMRELSDDLSEDTLWEVTTAWQDALSSNDIEMDEALLSSCAGIISEKLESFSMDKMTTSKMDRFTEAVSKLIICSAEGSSSKEVIVDNLILKLLGHNDTATTEYMKNLAECIELMQGNLIVHIENVAEKNDFLDSMDSFIKHNFFNLDVIIKLTCNIKINVSKKVANGIDDDLEPGDEIEFSDMQAHLQEEEVTEDYCDLSENLLKAWTERIYDKFFEVSLAEVVLDVFLMSSRNSQLLVEHENWIIHMQERSKLFMKHQPEFLRDTLREKLFDIANSKGGLEARSLLKLLSTSKYCSENGKISLYEDSATHANKDETIVSYINILQIFSECVEKKSLPITPNLFENYQNLLVKISASRSLIKNYLDVLDFNDLNEKKIVGNALIVVNEILTRQKSKPFLMYNKDVSKEKKEDVALTAEVANLLRDIITHFPHEIDVKRWDFIRIALSSWVLSVSKSNENFSDNKVKVFISSVFRLNAAFSKFIALEKTKSSTEVLQNVIDEWEKVFAREVNLVLIKAFVFVIKNLDYDSKHQEYFASTLCRSVGFIDFSFSLQSQKVDSTFSLQNLIAFALENLSNKYIEVSVASVTILKQLTKGLIFLDQSVLNQRQSEEVAGRHQDDENVDNNRWHILDSFRETLVNYQEVIKEYVEDFNFKSNEMDDLSTISPNIAFSYLLLWDLILNFCSKASPELRSIYARWITVHQFEEVFLVALFKLMPRDVVKNPDIKSSHAAFSSLEWSTIENLGVENDRYSAFLYAESLRTIPAVVRKWWHSSNTRKAQLIEKITQNYVTPILCQQDLSALTNKKEKDGKDNMQIKVLMQSREIFATYSLDEAKMELSISLPSNYPLGAIKIDSLKHIAGKFQAREIVKQLSIYLTHQNGRLYDGISLWKRNLDRKYEGVEECYVCYSVINQDTCQLPRLTCKTCKKKFHSNCLYKWFTTSNKSTCPLCRNVF